MVWSDAMRLPESYIVDCVSTRDRLATWSEPSGDKRLLSARIASSCRGSNSDGKDSPVAKVPEDMAEEQFNYQLRLGGLLT